jgi:sugar lactone lactonase YvrE
MNQLTVVQVPGDGAEDVVVDADGSVYTGTDDGSIFRVRADGGHVERVANTGGRPLGLELLPDGRLLVCDTDRGLLEVDLATGRSTVLADLVHGERILVCNNAAVHSSGAIYFTDSSRVYPLDRWKADMLENTASGRLLRRNSNGSVEVLIDSLRFANGVALARDESFVAVAESGGRTVVRLWLDGERTGQIDHLAADLPGYPDNIARGSDDLIWVTIASPTDALLERVMSAPVPLRRLVRWLSERLPEKLQPGAKQTVRVMALDDDGTVVHDLARDASAYHMATGVREHEGRVWLGSVEEPAIAYFDL